MNTTYIYAWLRVAWQASWMLMAMVMVKQVKIKQMNCTSSSLCEAGAVFRGVAFFEAKKLGLSPVHYMSYEKLVLRAGGAVTTYSILRILVLSCVCMFSNQYKSSMK